MQRLESKETKEKNNTSSTKSLVVEKRFVLKSQNEQSARRRQPTSSFSLGLNALPALRRNEEGRRPEIKRFDCLIYREIFGDFFKRPITIFHFSIPRYRELTNHLAMNVPPW
ncbi:MULTISPECIES: hypothetical protein [Acidaminococcus]|jgi:hypothetical protein|uniref:hypothetical protein n=1 Tax=Acidaminococcus TaxID=904 RepID=UPI00047DBE93|nr:MULTISPECIES: hypothetical protein [Acidaminococcus]MCG4850689.1 hypothetical protein [Acidaminococcus intestini]